jgi:hypothetical protein
MKNGGLKRNNLARYLIQENKLMIKKHNNKDFFRFVESVSENKLIKSIQR